MHVKADKYRDQTVCHTGSDEEPLAISEIVGGGNFWNDDAPSGQYDILDALHAKAVRMAVYPQWYEAAGNDNAVICALKHGANVHYQCEYTANANWASPDRSYNKWYKIGHNMAARYSPGSSLLVSKRFNSSQGVTRWSAINEPDDNQLLINDYCNMLKGYADGIHSINAAAKVFPGGYLSMGRDQNYTGNGYILTIRDLLNNGTLAGIDIHTYHDKLYAPIENTYGRSAQHDFDATLAACGITRKIDLVFSEHNFKNTSSNQGYDDAYVKRMFLPHLFDVWGVTYADNTWAVKMALPWNLFYERAGDEFWLTAGGTSWYQAGVVYKIVLDLLYDCYFVFNDPRGAGRYELRNANGSKYAWIFQNHHSSWSNLYGPIRRLDNIPLHKSTLKRYNHNGLQETIDLSGQRSQQVNSPTGETSIWVAQ